MFLGKLGCLSVGVGSSYLAQIGVKDREGRKVRRKEKMRIEEGKERLKKGRKDWRRLKGKFSLGEGKNSELAVVGS